MQHGNRIAVARRSPLRPKDRISPGRDPENQRLPPKPKPRPKPQQYNYTRTLVSHGGISTRPLNRPARARYKRTIHTNPAYAAWKSASTAAQERYEREVEAIRRDSARLSLRGAFSFLVSFRGKRGTSTPSSTRASTR